MKWSRLVAAVATVAVGLAVTAAADEKADKAIKELEQKFSKVNSYTCKWVSESNIDYGSGHTEKMKSVSMHDWMRKGPKAMMRMETTTTTTKTEEGKTTEEKSTSLVVSDGDFMYTLFDQGGQKTVMKNRAQQAKDAHPKALFEQLQQYNDITLLPDEKVDGEDCYVFELKPKPTQGQASGGRSVMYYQKSTGISIKGLTYDDKGQLTSTSSTPELKINADISPDRFKFEIPEGAQVMDMTATDQPPAQAETKEEAKAEEPEKEQPKEEEQEKPEKKVKVPKKPKLPKLP